MKLLITSGGTKIPIDRVRSITNMSTGTFGSKIATEALKIGNDVNFFKAENSKSPFTIQIDLLEKEYRQSFNDLADLHNKFLLYNSHYNESIYKNFIEYMSGLEKLIKSTKPDVIILAAAVSDYDTDNYFDSKIRTKSDLNIKLKPLPKVISKVKDWSPNSYLVGFKLLVDSTDEELINSANESIVKNKCDMVIANDLRDIKNNCHRLLIIKPNNNSILKYEYDHVIHGSNYLARKVIEEIMKEKI